MISKRQFVDEMEPIDDMTFNKLKDFVYGKCGITLTEKKKPLVSARIRKRMRALSLISPKEYFELILNDETGMEVVFLLDSIATNVTHFFREDKHFAFMKEKIREWSDKKQNRFRFWSSACSSGEEPYSMAFTIKDALGEKYKDTDTKILATDISTKVLGLAHQGMYEENKILTIPDDYRSRFMNKVKSENGNKFVVKPEIREMVTFKRLNLIEVPFPMRGPMDMILCRNVMIYFDRAIREKLVNEFYRLLRPGGYLLVGHTESLVGINVKLKRIGPSIYMK